MRTKFSGDPILSDASKTIVLLYYRPHIVYNYVPIRFKNCGTKQAFAFERWILSLLFFD